MVGSFGAPFFGTCSFSWPGAGGSARGGQYSQTPSQQYSRFLPELWLSNGPVKFWCISAAGISAAWFPFGTPAFERRPIFGTLSFHWNPPFLLLLRRGCKDIADFYFNDGIEIPQWLCDLSLEPLLARIPLSGTPEEWRRETTPVEYDDNGFFRADLRGATCLTLPTTCLTHVFFKSGEYCSNFN